MCLFFSFGSDLHELFEVQCRPSLALVGGRRRRTCLGEQDLGVLHVGMVEDRAGGGVAEEGDEGNFKAILDLDAAAFSSRPVPGRACRCIRA